VTIAPPTDLAPRVTSLDPADFPVPHGREEEWRFAPMERLQTFLEPHAGAPAVLAAEGDYITLVPISEVKDSWLPTDLPAALARANVSMAILVDIPAEAVITEPIVVDMAAPDTMGYLHLVVRAGLHSKATVIVKHDLRGDVAGSMVTEIADGADLTMVSISDGGSGRQLLHWPTSVGRDARFTGAVVTLDGSFIRISPKVHYAGPGGTAEHLGVFLADGDNYFEYRVFVEHEQPHCTSNVMYKGALSGEHAHTVWIGDVLVRRTAIGTDTYEMNRNLLLSDGPRADSVPNLELETGDVAGAGHASATGRFDDDQLFYLMSRGLTSEQARQLVVRGFFSEVVQRIPSVEWRTALMAKVDSRLGIPADADE
jgi:Fe-S cluster assembly protein SufD